MNKTSNPLGTDKSSLSFLNGKKATLLNFTADSYHWGCYGTSIEIYHTLLEKGFYVNTVSVDVTHGISPTIEKISDFDDDCWRRLNTDHLCRLNIDQGLLLT